MLHTTAGYLGQLLNLDQSRMQNAFLMIFCYFIVIIIWRKLYIFVPVFSRESDPTFTNVRSFVRLSVLSSSKPLNSLKSSSFIIQPSSFIIFHSSFIHHFSFILHSSFFIHPSFISRLLSFSACLQSVDISSSSWFDIEKLFD